MACNNTELPLSESNCNIAGTKIIYIMNASDVKIKNGCIEIKRKYGKFKRPVFKYGN